MSDSSFKYDTHHSTKGKFISIAHINSILKYHIVWILDTGATDHIICSLEYFDECNII